MKKPKYLLHPLRPLLRQARRPPPGSSPGVVARPEQREVPPPRVTYLSYGPEGLVEAEVQDPDELRRLRGARRVLWINVDGVEHVGTVQRIGEIFALHRLALADVVNVPQRAKLEDYGEYLFVVMQMAKMENDCFDSEQLGVFLGPDYVLTFQEHAGDPLDPVRERLRHGIGRIRAAGADYLAYAVLDAVVDYYFPALECLGEERERLEQQILEGAKPQVMARLYAVKRDLTAMRRAIWPARDALNILVRDPHPVVEEETRIYLRDCYDHIVQCIDLLESYRDLTASLTDLYFSTVSTRTNEIMKVLTIFSAIFIPLTFIAGVYGMNFDPEASPLNMPELQWFWGYPFALGIMLAVALTMLLFFRRKGWLGGGSEDAPPVRG